MTRCIHCTRCVRFTTEVCGDYSLGVLGRGLMMEIGTYIEKSIETELSGNVIDLCPVGALTSMPYAFAVRFWELTTVYSIDVLDALASSVRFDIANNSVVRVVPMQDENVNEE
jgi:NADH dehydrogenase/NADH:ubiquinone oxidoreductase subunit G